MSNIKQKIDEFNKRFSIVDNTTYEKEFSKFKTRVLNIFEDIDRHVTDESIATFCNILGIKEEWRGNGYNPSYSKNIIDALRNESNEKQFYRLIQIIFLLDIKTEQGIMPYEGIIYSRDRLYQKLHDALGFSSINLSITYVNKEIILYPKGEKTFDQELVNEVLTFLNPESYKHFVDALSFYPKGKTHNSVKSAESLRRSLEEFIRFKLTNNSGLNENIKELQKRFKTDSRDPQIRNIIFSVFSYLDQYFNENSKHQDGDINESENEYLIYQTGVLMRYINNIKS